MLTKFYAYIIDVCGGADDLKYDLLRLGFYSGNCRHIKSLHEDLVYLAVL